MDIGDAFIQVLDSDESHRYLGRLLNLDVSKRVGIELHNRINAAWGKFHQNRTWLMNSQVSIRLRLRLFDACVSPAVLFATSVPPLGRKDLEAAIIVQRKMLRLIVGWQRISKENWADTMRRMNARVAATLVQFPIKTWTETIFRHRWRYAAHMVLNTKMTWPRLLAKWIPLQDNYPGKQP